VLSQLAVTKHAVPIVHKSDQVSFPSDNTSALTPSARSLKGKPGHFPANTGAFIYGSTCLPV